MDRCRFTSNEDSTIIGVLADITRELSSTRIWEDRVECCLRLLGQLLPQGLVAAGFGFDGGWTVLQSEPEGLYLELQDELLQHFLALSGDVQTGAHATYQCDWHGRLETLALTPDDAFSGSFLSVPIVSESCVVGVLHVRSEDNDAYSPADEDLLTVVAGQLGSCATRMCSQRARYDAEATPDDLALQASKSLGELDTLVEVLADGVMIFDADCKPLRANSTVLSELGFNPGETKLIESLRKAKVRHPDGTPMAFSDMIFCRALRGETVRAEPMIFRSADGTDCHIVGSASPIRANGRIVGATATWQDMTKEKTAQLRREQNLQRLEALLRMSTEILAQTTLQAIIQDVVDTAREITGAILGTCDYRLQDGRCAVSATSVANGMQNHPPVLVCAHGYLRLDGIEEGGAVRLSGSQIRENSDLQNMFQDHVDVGGLLCAPLIGSGGKADGQLVLAHGSTSHFTEEDEALIKQLAVIASLRLRNIEAGLDAERRAAEAEESRRLLEALMEHIPDGIAIADAPDATVRMISRNGLEMLGLQGMPLSATPEAIAQSGMMWHTDGSTPVRAEEVPVYRAVVRGEHVANEEWILRGRDGAEVPILCSAVPIRDRNGVITGGIATYRDVSDIQAAQNALKMAYDREHHISEVLQQALLPTVSRDRPRYEVATEYHSAMVEAEVGGDFYDVFDVGEGWMALVMGDVSGKGLSAAIYTSMAKYMIRAYAHEDAEPKSVLRRLNEALAEFMNDETFITVFYGLLDTNRHILAYANAGHEPPLLHGNGFGSTTELDVTGPAVGMIPKVDYGQRVMPILPGSVLVVYTDGITDSRRGASFFGAEGLARVVSEHSSKSAHEISEAVHRAALSHAQGQLGDDAALLVLKPKF